MKCCKRIPLKDARQLARKFCKDFKIKKVSVYLVDRLSSKIYAIYVGIEPVPHILIEVKAPNRLGILLHELAHHLAQCACKDEEAWNNSCSHDNRFWQGAKERTITWARNNIADINWYPCFKANLIHEEMVDFQLNGKHWSIK